MSVLESMRSGTDSTGMQVVLALVLVSFIFWYSSPQGDTTQVVATVNGTKIMGTDLTRRMTMEARRYDRALSDAEEAQLQEQVRQSLIEDEALRQEAIRLGVTVSDTEVARELLRYEIFRNEEGLFDDRIYESWLRRNAYPSRSEFEEQMRRDILRGKLRQLVFMGVTVSEPVLEQAFREQNTRVDIRYARIRPTAFEDDVELDETELATFIQNSTERIKGTYEADFDRLYNLPAKVELTMVRLKVGGDGLGVAELRPRLEKIKADVEAGADMDLLARQYSEDPSATVGGSLGQLNMPTLSTAAADALGAIEVGQITGVVVEDAHISLYRLDARQPAKIIELSEVERDIASDLMRQERAPALAAAYAEEVLAAWQASNTLPEEKLAEQSILSATTGLVPLQGGGGLFSPPADMLQAASRAEPGSVLPEVYTSGDILWVGSLVEREDADMASFDAERDLIRESVLQQRRSEFYTGWIGALVADARVQ